MLLTPLRLFAKDTPCTIVMPGGTRQACTYQAADRSRSRSRFGDGWLAVSTALGLLPFDIVRVQQQAADRTCFTIAKVAPEAAAAEGFAAKQMSETERVRRTTTISADGTVTWPLSSAAMAMRHIWIAPAAAQLWEVTGEQPCTLQLPSGAQQERSIYRPGQATNWVIKGWGTAVRELELRADDVIHLQAVQKQPLQLRVVTDRCSSATAIAAAAGPAPARTAATDTPDPEAAAGAADAAAAAEAAVWQQWVPLSWRGSSLHIPERRHLFPPVDIPGGRRCTLLLPSGHAVDCAGRLDSTASGFRIGDGLAAVFDELQLAPGDLLQFRQDAPGSRRFHIQKLPPDAASIPPLHDHLAARRQRSTTAMVLPDETVRWPMTACCVQQLDVPAVAMDLWRLSAATQSTLLLPDGQHFERTISTGKSSYTGHMQGWRQVAAALQLEAGDLLHMRATQLEPLELQVHLTRDDGSPKPVAPAEQQAADTPEQQQPAEAATFQVWLSLEWRGTSLPLPDSRKHIVPLTQGQHPQRPCTLVLPSGEEHHCFVSSWRIGQGFPAVAAAMQLAPGNLLQLRQEAPGSRRFHIQKLPPSQATVPPPVDPHVATRERSRTKFILPDGTVQWLATSSMLGTLQLSGEQLELWGIQQRSDCTLVLPGQLRQPGTVVMTSKAGSIPKRFWAPVVEELQLQRGDVIHMRATGTQPLELHVHVHHVNSSLKVCCCHIRA